MIKTASKIERITISLPRELSEDIDSLKEELHVSKSEILKMAFEHFKKDHKKQKLKKVAEIMAKEYETNAKLTEFTALDSEDFK